MKSCRSQIKQNFNKRAKHAADIKAESQRLRQTKRRRGRRCDELRLQRHCVKKMTAAAAAAATKKRKAYLKQQIEHKGKKKP